MCIVSVASEVDKSQVNDKLRNLHDCDVLLEPDALSAGGLEVVVVHDDVYCKVESDGYPRDGRLSHELSIAEKDCSTVMVGV